RRRHTRFSRDWSSDVCSSDLVRWIMLPPTRISAPMLQAKRNGRVAIRWQSIGAFGRKLGSPHAPRPSPGLPPTHTPPHQLPHYFHDGWKKTAKNGWKAFGDLRPIGSLMSI